MEQIVSLLIPALLLILLIRVLVYPLQWALKLGVHMLFGFCCLWLLNSLSGFTGVGLPINGVTAWIAGVFGVPGILLIVLLEIW